MQILDLAVVSSQDKFKQRAEDCVHHFNFEVEAFFEGEELFSKAEQHKTISCILLDCTHLAKPSDIAGLTQVARQVAPESYILVVAGAKLQPEDARVVKTSGASQVIMEGEYYSSSKLEFILTQVIRSAYIPVKTVDIFEGSETSFSLFHLMPVNRKFLKVLKPGQRIRRDFLEKYKEVGELYLKRSDLAAWIEYSKTFINEDENENENLVRKCRLKFLQLNQSFLNLVLLVTDQASSSSFASGKELYDICLSFSEDLLNSLTHVRDPWFIISNSTVGDFGSVERSPAVAAYAGLLSTKSKTGDAKEVMIGALLSDVGYLDLSPSTTRKIRNNKLEEMNAEELMEFEKHPIFSLNQCLSRRLPLTENIKNMILQSHERADQKGFPNKPRLEKINEESMLVRLCWHLDSLSQIRMGKTRPNIQEVKLDLARTLQRETGNYSITFVLKMAKLLTESAQNGHVILA